MNTKLTLSLNKKIIESAKKYAKKNGQSLSELVENYFLLLTENTVTSDHPKSAKVDQLRGIISIDESIDYKQILAEELSKKYGV